MSSFINETLKARLYQNKAKYPSQKLDDILDWQLIGDKLLGHVHAAIVAAIVVMTP